MKRMLLLLLILAAVIPAHAGGPLGANGTTPRRYPAGAMPLIYKTDLGALGAFSNATAVAIAVYAFTQWDNVTSAAVSFSNGGTLSHDVSLSTDAYISGSSQFSDGVNPIVFDNNGSITDDRIGVGASNDIVGFAASASAGNEYVEGFAIINGVLTGTGSQADQDMYRATMTHEIGHLLGLSHTQVTLHGYYSTLYPSIHGPNQAVLRPDDTAAIASLYPTPAFLSATGAITGSLKRPNGANVSGICVIALDSATGATYTTVSDYYSGPGFRFDNNPAPTGSYTLSGLPPGTYFVRIETIRPEFSSGSSIASYEDPINLDVRPEWFNAGGESGDMLVDNSNLRTGIVVTAGATKSGINIITNESQTLSEFSYDNGTTAGYVRIPDGTNGVVTKYALRCTAPTLGSLVGIRFFLGDQSDLPLTGRLTVSVHTNIPGSVAGIPGAELGAVTIPFSALDANHDNEIYLRDIGQAINFPSGVDFHIVLQTNGVGLPMLYLDDGQGTQNRTSYFTNANGWRNMGQGLITIPHTMIMQVIYSNRPYGATAPALTPVPASVGFGEVRPAGNTTKSVQIRNTGTAPLNVASTAITGPDATLFSITAGGGSFVVQPGDSHAITLRFAPTDASGAKSASLTITSNDPDSPAEVPLSGMANQAIASQLVTQINLGSLGVGSTRNTDTIILRNTGNDSLRIYGGALVGTDAGTGIKILAGNGPRLLLPNAALTVRLSFAPTELRAYGATLRVAHDAGDTIVIPITGQGVGANATAPSEVIIHPVAVGACRDTNVYLRNGGNSPLTVTTMTVSGPGASDFTILAPALPVTLAPDDSTAIVIRFCPSVEGRRDAVLAVAHDAPGSPTSITLVGNPGTGGTDRHAIATGGMRLSLLPVIPNPTQGGANVAWRVSGSGSIDVETSIVDLRGNTVIDAGRRRVTVNGAEEQFSTGVELGGLPAGEYVVVVRAGGQVLTQRIIR